MKKFVSIFKNKEIVGRIFFTVMIIFVIRIGAAITVPGIKATEALNNAMNSGNAISLMNLMGGGALSNFSVLALGVSPYITAQIIIQLLSKDVLPALTELSKQGEYGRKKSEMATRYLTLLLGAVQSYGIIRTMENNNYIEFSSSFPEGFWRYAYLVRKAWVMVFRSLSSPVAFVRSQSRFPPLGPNGSSRTRAMAPMS